MLNTNTSGHRSCQISPQHINIFIDKSEYTLAWLINPRYYLTPTSTICTKSLFTVQKMKVSIKNFFSKCDRRYVCNLLWSMLRKKNFLSFYHRSDPTSFRYWRTGIPALFQIFWEQWAYSALNNRSILLEHKISLSPSSE